MLLHDLESELQRQQHDSKLIEIRDSLNSSYSYSGRNNLLKNAALSTSLSSNNMPPIAASAHVKHDPRSSPNVPESHDNISNDLQVNSLHSRQNVGMRKGNQPQPVPDVAAVSRLLLHDQQRPISPTFKPLPCEALTLRKTPQKISPSNTSPPCTIAATSVSPTFLRSDPDVSSFDHVGRQSISNESSVSPTFGSFHRLEAFSPRDSVVILSNVKRCLRQDAAATSLAFETEAPNTDCTLNFSTFSSDVIDVESPIESRTMPILHVVTQTTNPFEDVHVEKSSYAATEFDSMLAQSRMVSGPKESASWGGDVLKNRIASRQSHMHLESVAQANPVFTPTEYLDELNSCTLRNLMRHQLVERTPVLTQIFVPVTSTVAYVLCDLNAGPSALGRRFSDNINQLRPEIGPISPRKVGQGKCLKVLLLEPPQMRVSELFSNHSMCAQECFLYMNTDSTVEIISCLDAVLSAAIDDGNGTEISRVPCRLSMNDFLRLAKTIRAWNLQSQDHVCCILMDVVFGANISALLLGMLSLVIGHCSDVKMAQKLLHDKGNG